MRGIRGKRVKMAKEGTLIVTVDVGMTSNRGYCTTVDGRDIKPFKFDNTREGIDLFWSMILTSKNRFRCSDVMVGYESTSPYAEPLVQSSMSLCASFKRTPYFSAYLPAMPWRHAISPNFPWTRVPSRSREITFFMLCYHRGLSRLSVPKVSMRPTFHRPCSLNILRRAGCSAFLYRRMTSACCLPMGPNSHTLCSSTVSGSK